MEYKEEIINLYRDNEVLLLSIKDLELNVPLLFKKLSRIYSLYIHLNNSIYDILNRVVIFYKINESLGAMFVCELNTSTILYKIIFDTVSNIIGGHAIYRMAKPGEILHRHIDMITGHISELLIDQIFDEITSLLIVTLSPELFKKGK